MPVGFRSGHGHVQLEAVGEDQNRSAEALVGLDASAHLTTQRPGKCEAVSLDHQVQIQVVPTQQQIPNKAPDYKGRHASLIRHLAGLPQEGKGPVRQTGLHQPAEIALERAASRWSDDPHPAILAGYPQGVKH